MFRASLRRLAAAAGQPHVVKNKFVDGAQNYRDVISEQPWTIKRGVIFIASTLGIPYLAYKVHESGIITTKKVMDAAGATGSTVVAPHQSAYVVEGAPTTTAPRIDGPDALVIPLRKAFPKLSPPDFYVNAMDRIEEYQKVSPLFKDKPELQHTYSMGARTADLVAPLDVAVTPVMLRELRLIQALWNFRKTATPAMVRTAGDKQYKAMTAEEKEQMVKDFSQAPASLEEIKALQTKYPLPSQVLELEALIDARIKNVEVELFRLIAEAKEAEYQKLTVKEGASA